MEANNKQQQTTTNGGFERFCGYRPLWVLCFYIERMERKKKKKKEKETNKQTK